jgi:H+/Cl- antiporter ClcA
VDGLYFQDSPLLLRAAIFFAGLFFGSTLGYILATLLFDYFFPRYCSIMEEPANKK